MLLIDKNAKTDRFPKLWWFFISWWGDVGFNWNVYSVKLHRMNSIENTLHSSTGHFKTNTWGGVAAAWWRLKATWSSLTLTRLWRQTSGHKATQSMAAVPGFQHSMCSGNFGICQMFFSGWGGANIEFSHSSSRNLWLLPIYIKRCEAVGISQILHNTSSAPRHVTPWAFEKRGEEATAAFWQRHSHSPFKTNSAKRGLIVKIVLVTVALL